MDVAAVDAIVEVASMESVLEPLSNAVSRPVRSAMRVVALAFGLLALGCGGAVESDGLPLVTIAECQGLDGVPLFDPEDERPIELSCPDGLLFIAEFDEEFFGAEGGICCTNPEP